MNKKENMSEAHAIRRENIRKAKLFTYAATKIQTQFRMYRARQEKYMLRELKRLAAAEVSLKAEIRRLGVWWTIRDEIPSKKLYMDEKGNSKTGESILSLLPPLKLFGRKRDHLTHTGWGRRDGVGKWKVVDQLVEIDDSHPTQIMTKKLFSKGYDLRRVARFKGLFVKSTYDDKAATSEAVAMKKAEDDKIALAKKKRDDKLKKKGKLLMVQDEAIDDFDNL